MSHSVGYYQRKAEELGWPKTAEELECRIGDGKYTAVLDGMFHSLVGSSANVGEVLPFVGIESNQLTSTFKVYFNAGKATHTVEIDYTSPSFKAEDSVTVLLPLEGVPVKHLLHEYKEIHWSFDRHRVHGGKYEDTEHVTRVNPTATLAICVLTYQAAVNGDSHGIRVDTVSYTFAGDAGKEEMFWADLTSKAEE